MTSTVMLAMSTNVVNGYRLRHCHLASFKIGKVSSGATCRTHSVVGSLLYIPAAVLSLVPVIEMLLSQ
jgi:hypothetical protein